MVIQPYTPGGGFWEAWLTNAFQVQPLSMMLLLQQLCPLTYAAKVKKNIWSCGVQKLGLKALRARSKSFTPTTQFIVVWTKFPARSLLASRIRTPASLRRVSR